MRLTSKTPVRVRDVLIGGEEFLICLPLVATTSSGVLEEATEAVERRANLIEWRVDSFLEVENLDCTLETLESLRAAIGNIPLIFTCRDISEGGQSKISAECREELYLAAISSRLVDLVDIELSAGSEAISALRKASLACDVKIILSYHSFSDTPEEGQLLRQLALAEELGADIAKIAVMPKEQADVLTLLEVSLKARTSLLEIPLIAISMGKLGGISRVLGGMFGSDITFASGSASSAPGQIPIDELRRTWSLLKVL